MLPERYNKMYLSSRGSQINLLAMLFSSTDLIYITINLSKKNPLLEIFYNH